MSESFDGQDIGGYVASIPSVKLEAPDSYQRGTYLTLKVEVRVRSIHYDEITTGKNKGDLNKVHMLAIEDVQIIGVTTPAERAAIYEAAAKAAEDWAAQPALDDIIDAEVVPDQPALEHVGGGSESLTEQVDPSNIPVSQEDWMWDDEPAEAAGASVGF